MHEEVAESAADEDDEGLLADLDHHLHVPQQQLLVAAESTDIQR